MAAAKKDNKDKFTDDNKKTYKLDASSHGCSGMYWRNAKGNTSGVDQSNWPKNGTILKGWKCADNLIKLDNGHYMLIKQNGDFVMHEQK